MTLSTSVATRESLSKLISPLAAPSVPGQGLKKKIAEVTEQREQSQIYLSYAES